MEVEELNGRFYGRASSPFKGAARSHARAARKRTRNERDTRTFFGGSLARHKWTDFSQLIAR